MDNNEIPARGGDGASGHARVLENIAHGAPLEETLDDLALLMGNNAAGFVCGICVLAPEANIITGCFGPGLPETCRKACIGLSLDSAESSPCAAAVCGEETVVAGDIVTDPRWGGTAWRSLVLDHGFQSCHATIIRGSNGGILGTLSLYARNRLENAPVSFGRTAAYLAGIAIERHRQETAFHESETRLQLAVGAARLGLWDWEIGGRVTFSPEHNRMFGLEPGTREGTYQMVMEHIHPDDRPLVEKAVSAALAGREDCKVEFRTVGGDGVIRWVAAHGRPRYDRETGHAKNMIGMVCEITERKQAEDRLRGKEVELSAALAAAEFARKEAEMADSAKDRFLAVLSHELRTPLTPVLMAVSYLGKDASLPPQVRDSLQMIQRNINLEARLIEDLLDLTRISGNKMELHVGAMDLDTAVREALDFCNEDAGAKNHRLHVDLAAVHSRIIGDPERLRQAFWNILKNAVKFTRAGGEISIRSRNEGPRVLVEITDSGIGIPSSALPWIFSPFEQGGENVMREFGGLGLGLAISKAIIDAHHGTLEVFSEGEDRGVTFVAGFACETP